jgi:hypothetical protein
LIAQVEQRRLFAGEAPRQPADRGWILHTYADCINAVKGVKPGDKT